MEFRLLISWPEDRLSWIFQVGPISSQGSCNGDEGQKRTDRRQHERTQLDMDGFDEAGCGHSQGMRTAPIGAGKGKEIGSPRAPRRNTSPIP